MSEVTFDNLSISIHTPLAGSDFLLLNQSESSSIFQSTLPSRGVTTVAKIGFNLDLISIHTPLAGSDRNISYV